MISPRLDHLLRRFIVNFDVTLRGLRKVFFGTIEFTHTSRKVADVLDSVKDIGRPLRFAKLQAAWRDLKRVGRNVHLVDEGNLIHD